MFPIKFNPSAFAQDFIRRKTSRWLDTQFTFLGKERLLFVIKNNRNLVDFIPPELLQKYKADAKAYAESAKQFTDDDVYSWIPDKWKALIEAEPDGKEWAYRQIPLIRQIILAS